MSNQVMDAPVTDRHVAAQSILQRAVVLVLECRYLGNTRKVRVDKAVEAATNGASDHVDDAVANQLHVTKRLVDSKTLTRAMAVGGSAKSYLRTKAIPAHRVFGERAYLVPIDLVEQVDEGLRGFAAMLQIEAQAVADQWAEAVAKQAVALGSLFDATQYVTADEAAQAFAIDWSYVSFAAPERLEHVNAALFESAQARFESKMADAYDEVKVVLRETLLQLTRAVSEKLRPGEDGKPKVFRNTILADLTDFLSTFSVRNLSDDAELDAVVRRLHALTDGIDAEQLRDLDHVRETVAAGIAEAVGQLDGLVETGRRGISFGDLG